MGSQCARRRRKRRRRRRNRRAGGGRQRQRDVFRQAWEYGDGSCGYCRDAEFALALVFYFHVARDLRVAPNELLSTSSPDPSATARYAAAVRAQRQSVRGGRAGRGQPAQRAQCEALLLRSAAESEGVPRRTPSRTDPVLMDVATIAPLLGLLGTFRAC
jgi:hypothetical protein